MGNDFKDITARLAGGQKSNLASHSHPDESREQMRKPLERPPAAANRVEDEMMKLQAAKVELQRIRASARHELELARQIRAQAEKYQQETETRARSQAQRLILHARLETRKKITELERKTCEEMQKALADIRMIRITAQEELEAQRKFTAAARIRALSLTLQEAPEPKPKPKKMAKEAVSV